MLKKLLIALALLTASANANFFEALKDAAEKAIEEQRRLENPVEDHSAEDKIEASIDQPSTQKFNSLAEEEAFKKKQEEHKVTDAKKYEQDFKSNIIPRIQRLRISEANFYQKYLIKENDSQEMIDNKFKVRTQLYNTMKKDFAVLDAERKSLYDILDSDKFSDVQSKLLKDHFKEMTWYGELSSIFTNAKKNSPEDYIVSCGYSVPFDYTSDQIYIDDLRTKSENFKDEDTYEKYLKCTYLTYQKRQDEIVAQVKREQMLKDQKIKLANEQKERQKVQQVCKAWRAKANKQVYSLGIGDRVTGKGTGYYVVQGVNANTFLVNTLGGFVYLQKSDLVPYDSIKTAPSEYCYR